jgi:hypothetical protein
VARQIESNARDWIRSDRSRDDPVRVGSPFRGDLLPSPHERPQPLDHWTRGCPPAMDAASRCARMDVAARGKARVRESAMITTKRIVLGDRESA